MNCCCESMNSSTTCIANDRKCGASAGGTTPPLNFNYLRSYERVITSNLMTRNKGEPSSLAFIENHQFPSRQLLPTRRRQRGHFIKRRAVVAQTKSVPLVLLVQQLLDRNRTRMPGLLRALDFLRTVFFLSFVFRRCNTRSA